MDLASPPALTVEGVSYAYGSRPALADVSFAIAPATFAVLLGLNGAGKTTLFSLITRLFATQERPYPASSAMTWRARRATRSA